MTRLVIIDAETTGLDERVHESWEWGLIVRDEAPLTGEYGTRKDTEYLWRIKPDLAKADPLALAANRYYERTKTMHSELVTSQALNLVELDDVRRWGWSDPAAVAYEVARLIDGAVVVGANPGFDRDFLRPFLHAHGQAYTAHYRPVCVTVLGWGFLLGQGKAEGLSWPLSSNEVSQALGVDPGDFDRHTALGDCAWARAQYEVVTGSKP